MHTIDFSCYIISIVAELVSYVAILNKGQGLCTNQWIYCSNGLLKDCVVCGQLLPEASLFLIGLPVQSCSFSSVAAVFICKYSTVHAG